MPAIAKKGILYTEVPSVENRVVEGNQNPVTSGAVYKELGDTSVNNDLGANVSNQIGNLHTQIGRLTSDRVQLSLDAVAVGKDEDGDTIYEKTFKGSTISDGTIVDSNLTSSKLKWFHLVGGCVKDSNDGSLTMLPYQNPTYNFIVYSTSNGLVVEYHSVAVEMYHFTVQYVLK